MREALELLMQEKKVIADKLMRLEAAGAASLNDDIERRQKLMRKVEDLDQQLKDSQRAEQLARNDLHQSGVGKEKLVAELAILKAEMKELARKHEEEISKRAKAEEAQADLLGKWKRDQSELEMLRQEVSEKTRDIDTMQVELKAYTSAKTLSVARKGRDPVRGSR